MLAMSDALNAALDFPYSGLIKARTTLARLEKILSDRDLYAVYQPIVSLSTGKIIGYEGLIRGPEGSDFSAPLALFDAARECGLTSEFELLSRSIVIQGFARLGIEGRLFLNVSPDALVMDERRDGENLHSLAEYGLQPGQVVIELTENDPTIDYAQLRRAADHYRALGFSIAMDDLGEGFSSLRLWSELRPDFVKIDKHFIRAIQQDQIRQQFVRSIQEIASNSGCQVIAEGIETEDELIAVREIGVANGQGYLFARPQRIPQRSIPGHVLQWLQDGTQVLQIQPGHFSRKGSIIKLLKCVRPVSVEQSNEEVFQLFEANPALFSVPVVEDMKPVGLISRYSMIDRFARPFRKELYGRKSCRMLMDEQPLVVDVGVTIHELSSIILNMAPYHLAAGFIITEQGSYLGIGSGHDLLRQITQMQITAARYSNPLTMLPGNVPINEHIDAMIASEEAFCVCYFDLDNFKPYNDVYGFRKGDEIIKLTGSLLETHGDNALDFVGHIGGDDFIVVFRSPDWQERCQQLLEQFAVAVPDYYEPEDRHRGGIDVEDRQGNTHFQSFISLSIGAVCLAAGEYDSHHEVASAATRAKKQAKKQAGNSLFVERRSPPAGA